MASTLARSLLFWVVFVVALFGSSKLAHLAPPEWTRLAQAILGTLAALFLIRIFLRVEKRSFADVDLVWQRGTLPRFLLGLVIGAALLGVALIALVGLTDLQLLRNPTAGQAPLWVGSLAVIGLFAFMEELVFRSYAYVRLDRAYGFWVAQLVAAVAFALYHVVSGWSLYASFMGPFVWAFVFGVAAIRSGGIAMPTGIHVALNALQVFTGLKGDKGSYWILGHEQGQAINAPASEETVGALFQLAVLAAALASTWYVAQRSVRTSLSEA